MKNKIIMIVSVGILLVTVGCGKLGKRDEDLVEGEEIGAESIVTSVTGVEEEKVEISEEVKVWYAKIKETGVIGEVENNGVLYQLHMYEGLKYIHNTTTEEIKPGSRIGDATKIVLKDWLSAQGDEVVSNEEAIFEGVWTYSNSRAQKLLGYCVKNYELVTRARTSEYLEYIFKDTEGKYQRLALTDDYILYAPLTYSYIFDIDSY